MSKQLYSFVFVSLLTVLFTTCSQESLPKGIIYPKGGTDQINNHYRIKEVTLDCVYPQEEELSSISLSYDLNGKLATITQTTDESPLPYTTTFIYNSNGLRYTSRKLYSDIYEIQTEYLYNTNNLLQTILKEVVVLDPMYPISNFTESYEYTNTDMHRTRCTYSYNDVLISTYEYRYNTSNVLYQIIEYTSENVLAGYYDFIYSDNHISNINYYDCEKDEKLTRVISFVMEESESNNDWELYMDDYF
jgi:hypothetical protein